MKSFTVFVLFLSLVLVKSDYFNDYFETWLMREKMECVFEEYNVTEDVLSHVPKKMLKVQIGDTKVIPGDKFSPLSLVSPPNVTWDCEDPHIKHGSEIAIVMVGADPGHQSLVWLVEGITGCDVCTGQEVCKYRPPSRPSDSRSHLYIICQFMRQPTYYHRNQLSFGMGSETSERKNLAAAFSMARFAIDGKYGNPYACNFIVIQNSDTTPQEDEQVNRHDSHCAIFDEFNLRK